MSTLDVVEELKSTADWRRDKAAEYPDDSRNLQAAEFADCLAVEIAALKGPLVQTFDDFYELMLSDEEESSHEIFRRWSEYRSRLGFASFPSNGEEYLRDLMELARQAAGLET